MVAAAVAFGWWRWTCRVAVEPVLDHVVIKLLGPEQAAESLAHDLLRIVGQVRGMTVA